MAVASFRVVIEIGFNFAMATSRFDARTTLMQEEVNAINTAYLVTLPPPQRRECTQLLLRAYVTARIERGCFVMQALLDPVPATALTVLHGQPPALP